MRLVVYLVSLFVLAVAIWVVFRLIVRRDYRRKGQLTLLSSFLESYHCAKCGSFLRSEEIEQDNAGGSSVL